MTEYQSERDRVNAENGRILKPLLGGVLLIGIVLTGLLISSGTDPVLSFMVGLGTPVLGFAALVPMLSAVGILTRLDSVEDR
jgi:hypothetical protein